MLDVVGSSCRKRRGRLLVAGNSLLPVTIGGLLFSAAWLMSREYVAQERLSQRVEAIETQGLPFDSPSLRVYYESLTSDQNTDEWLQVLEQLESDAFVQDCQGVPVVGLAKGVPLDDREGWPEEQAALAFVAKWDKLHQRTVKVARQGGAVRFPIEFNSIETSLAHAQSMRSAAQILKLCGELAIRRGDSKAYRENLDGLYGCTEVLSGDPILVSQLVSCAIDAIAMQLLQDGLKHGMLGKDDLQHFIGRSMSRTQLGPEWKQCVHGGRATMLPIFRGEFSVPVYTLGAGNSRLPFRGIDANTYLDLIDQVLAVETGDVDQFLAGLQQHHSAMERTFRTHGLIQRFDNGVTALMMPAYRAAGGAFARRAVVHRLAVLSMGTRLYYLKSNAFPETLSDLKSLGLDTDELKPVDGQSFSYRIDDEFALLQGSNESAGPAAVPRPIFGGQSSELSEHWIWRVAK